MGGILIYSFHINLHTDFNCCSKVRWFVVVLGEGGREIGYALALELILPFSPSTSCYS